MTTKTSIPAALLDQLLANHRRPEEFFALPTRPRATCREGQSKTIRLGSGSDPRERRNPNLMLLI